ncbi:hypothetical protein [Actinosynnema sp.]|uniref:hypothetical protein n=1 Tax=Actinosynnema sp. TaxID=1872144 RepID=UPI003F87246D
MTVVDVAVERPVSLDGLVYRLVLAVDVEGYSKLSGYEQGRAQSLLDEVMEHAARRSGLDRGDWYRQVRGDGELAVLPADTDTAWVVARFTERLRDGLAALRAAGTPLRVRLAMHCGPLAGGRYGLVGETPIRTCRLLDAPVVRRALAAADGDLVLVVSDGLFRDVVSTRFHQLDPERFRRTWVTAKKTRYAGYVCTACPSASPNP